MYFHNGKTIKHIKIKMINIINQIKNTKFINNLGWIKKYSTDTDYIKYFLEAHAKYIHKNITEAFNWVSFNFKNKLDLKLVGRHEIQFNLNYFLEHQSKNMYLIKLQLTITLPLYTLEDIKQFKQMDLPAQLNSANTLMTHYSILKGLLDLFPYEIKEINTSVNSNLPNYTITFKLPKIVLPNIFYFNSSTIMLNLTTLLSCYDNLFKHLLDNIKTILKILLTLNMEKITSLINNTPDENKLHEVGILYLGLHYEAIQDGVKMIPLNTEELEDIKLSDYTSYYYDLLESLDNKPLYWEEYTSFYTPKPLDTSGILSLEVFKGLPSSFYNKNRTTNKRFTFKPINVNIVKIIFITLTKDNLLFLQSFNDFPLIQLYLNVFTNPCLIRLKNYDLNGKNKSYSNAKSIGKVNLVLIKETETE